MPIKKSVEEAPKKKFAAPVKTVSNKKTPTVKAKKSANEPKVEKSAGKPRTALYRLLSETKPTWEAFKTQKGVVRDAFVKACAVGKKGIGITSADLYAALDGKLETNSTVERIAGFYLSVWKKDGILEKYEPTA